MNEAMSRHTTFRIGGNADVFIMPKRFDEILGIGDIHAASKEAVGIAWKESLENKLRKYTEDDCINIIFKPDYIIERMNK